MKDDCLLRSLFKINDDSLRFNNAREDAHDEVADDAGETRNSLGLIINLDGFFSFGRQHLVKQGQHLFIEETIFIIHESSGSRDLNGLGKNSQVCSFLGKHFWHLLCKMFRMIMKHTMVSTMTPAHILGILPAMEIPNTDNGSSKNIMTRYRTANQRYVAVVVPRNLASLTGILLNGLIGKNSMMPDMLKNR